MKKNSYIGYSISLISGLIIIASAFLPLTMTSLTGNITQGASVYDILFNSFNALTQTMSVAVVLFAIAIVLAVVEVICAIIGLIVTAKNKYFKAFLIVERVIGLLAFLCAIISFILLGIDLLAIESISYNFVGFGIVTAILGTLLLIEGIFLVRKPLPDGKKKDEEEI